MKKHALIVVIVLLVAAASLACVASPTSTPAATSTPAHTDTPASTLPPTVAPTSTPPGYYDGVWVARTNTEDSIVITVENDAVTKMEITVTVYGEGWQATTEKTYSLSSEIVDGVFLVDVEEAGWGLYVKGLFGGDVLVGSLFMVHEHPQGFGTGYAAVEFEAQRSVGP